MIYGKKPENPSHVLSLTIIDGSTLDRGSICEDTKILLVVRNKETNRTHPNVISVPTQRIPRRLFINILQSGIPIKQVESTTYYKSDEVRNASTNGHHPIIYAVESALSRKLNIADDLETEMFIFECRLYSSIEGKSYHPNLPVKDGREEYISMVSLFVCVREGIDFIPTRSASYSRIFWTEAKTFLDTVQRRDPLVVGLDPIDYCIHGLCILSAYQIIMNELGIDENLDDS